MKRVWLLLADTLVIASLFLSFIFFYLYPPIYVLSNQYKSLSENESNRSLSLEMQKNITLSLLREMNTSKADNSALMSLEEILQLSQEVAMETYLKQEEYVYVSLRERLKALQIEQGAPLFIRIFKKEALLEIWIEKEGKYVHLKDYPICAYSGQLGPKLKEGDKQAPEGFYRVYPAQLNPRSKFHLAFNLGYPNAYDRAHHRTGSYLMVHGRCTSIGCYAMTDKKIEEIYGLVEAALKNGQAYVPVHIFPFKMEDVMMDSYSESKWYDFWMELKEGYDYFEAEEIPPRVEVINGEYVIKEAGE